MSMIWGGRRKAAVQPEPAQVPVTDAERKYHESNQWGR